MPFVDKDKEKAYYHNHKKFYQREYQKKNRKSINEFQARRKREKIREEVDRLRQKLLAMELGEENSKAFRAIVVMFTIWETDIRRPQGLAARTGYGKTEINEYYSRLQ